MIDLEPTVLGGPFGDPAVLVKVSQQRHPFLIDCGELPLRPGVLGRILHLLLSHLHIDHAIGFDHLVRMQLPRPQRLRVLGPEGTARRLASRLAGYVWNLETEGWLELEILDLGPTILSRTLLRCDQHFVPIPLPLEGPLLEGFALRWAVLDHGVPCLAYALKAPDRYLVQTPRLEASGLKPGPWLKELVSQALNGTLGPLDVQGTTKDGRALAKDLLIRQAGASLAYVTDIHASPANLRAARALVQGSDILLCEAMFHSNDRALASRSHHLTAKDAGSLARDACVGELILFHVSRRYEGNSEAILADARAVFPAARLAP